MKPIAFAIGAVLLSGTAPATAIAQTAKLVAALERVGGTGADSSMSFRIVISMGPGWHIGAPRPGALGVPTALDWQLPEGWKLTAEKWPAPKLEIVARDSVFTYRGSIVVDASIVKRSGARRDPLQVVLSYGVCSNEVCIPGRVKLTYVQ